MTSQKTILITGANSDIGVEVCRNFLRKGDKIIAMVNNDSSNLKEFLNERIRVIKIDFSIIDSIEIFIKNNKDLLNSVDVFVSLASIRESIDYDLINGADLISHFTINSIPVILLTKYLGKSMSAKGWGRIVIGSSIGVKFGGGRDTYCYSVAKYAAELIPNIAKQWSRNNVLVNVVRIGVTNTNKFRELEESEIKKRAKLIPMQRLAEVDEVGKFIYHIGSEENTYITRQVLSISGGE
jgi:NAD(P)-dependent dehydrogenase (short-subunit alcohol dehydrogenase family)